MYMANELDECVVSVMIPLNPMEPWMATVISIELDNTVDQRVQLTLTCLCGSRLADIAVMPIAFFPICYQVDPRWQQHAEVL
jgi:hypothetical protein